MTPSLVNYLFICSKKHPQSSTSTLIQPSLDLTTRIYYYYTTSGHQA